MSWRNPTLVTAAGVALMVGGCISPMVPDPVHETTVAATSPTENGASFYPLAVGNHWSYEDQLRTQIFPDVGDPLPPITNTSSLTADLIGIQEHLGRTYFVQREVRGTAPLVRLYREDREGLYIVFLPSTSTSAASMQAATAAIEQQLASLPESIRGAYRATLARLMDRAAPVLQGPTAASLVLTTAGPAEGENVALTYPLAPSKSWIYQPSPFAVTYTVEGFDKLSLPAGDFKGWRIRANWVGNSKPGEYTFLWYGRDGFLQLKARFIGTAVDADGQPIGTVSFEITQQLNGLSLVTQGS